MSDLCGYLNCPILQAEILEAEPILGCAKLVRVLVFPICPCLSSIISEAEL